MALVVAGDRVGHNDLEKSLKDLERLLRGEGGENGSGGEALAGRLRSVLQKLLEAWFNPADGA